MTGFVLVLQLLMPPDPAATLWLIPPGELALSASDAPSAERGASAALAASAAPAALEPGPPVEPAPADAALLPGPAPVASRQLAWPKPQAVGLASVLTAAADAGTALVALGGAAVLFDDAFDRGGGNPLTGPAGLALFVAGAAAFVVLPPQAGVLGARLGGEPRERAGLAYRRGQLVRIAGAVAAALFFRYGAKRAGWTSLLATELVAMPAVVAGTLAVSRAVPEQDPASLR